MASDDGGRYKVVRTFLEDDSKRTVATGLTLEQARAHCGSLESSYGTCTKAAGKARTRKYGPGSSAITG